MKSVIVPFRNREEHISVLFPALANHFKNEDWELIVSEQDDDAPFNIAAVQNIGYKYSTGNTVIFQQCDYVPTDDVSYEVTDCPVLPARRGLFVLPDNKTPRPIEDIPAGYRNWSNEIDPYFYGGVIAMKREHFEAVNGYNSMIKSWGHEDVDLRYRFEAAGIPVKRNQQGTFVVLYHRDNNPELYPEEGDELIDYMQSKLILANFHQYRHLGYRNLTADVDKFTFELDGIKKGIWLKSTNYKME